MYKNDDGQITFEEFISPFKSLDKKNRWVKSWRLPLGYISSPIAHNPTSVVKGVNHHSDKKSRPVMLRLI